MEDKIERVSAGLDILLEEMERLRREMEVAAPEVAVFRDHFKRFTKDYTDLLYDATTLPEDTRDAAYQTIRAWLKQALEACPAGPDKGKPPPAGQAGKINEEDNDEN